MREAPSLVHFALSFLSDAFFVFRRLCLRFTRFKIDRCIKLVNFSVYLERVELIK